MAFSFASSPLSENLEQANLSQHEETVVEMRKSSYLFFLSFLYDILLFRWDFLFVKIFIIRRWLKKGKCCIVNSYLIMAMIITVKRLCLQ